MVEDLRLAWDLWGIWRQIKGGTMDDATWLQLATLLIPVVSPLITAGIKKLIPKIPKLAIIVLQPILGAVLGGLSGVDPTLGAGLGVTGIGVREATKQTTRVVRGQ